MEKRWELRDQVKMIVVPVRMSESWFLYMTTRSRAQSVVRIAKAFRSEGG